MADFTVLTFDANDGNNGTPNWVNVLGTPPAKELRFSDSSAQANVASASWPYTTRPASGTAGVDYAYAFTADTTGQGVDSGATSVPAAFTRATYLQTRWNWDNLGTMASAPIFTAYPTTAHGSVTRGDGSLLGGHASDTGGTARSYLKGLAYGITASQQTPAAQPSADPVVTDGTTGTVTTSTGAWSGVQGLQGDNDFITCGDTPPAVTARFWYTMVRLFMGANMSPGLHQPVISLKYTYV
jgi:hypothetical protein